MTSWTPSKSAKVLLASIASIALTAGLAAQTQTPAAPPSAADRAAITAASLVERDRELKLLGITEMQPGATAYDIGKPGNANYDESKANPYPKLPRCPDHERRDHGDDSGAVEEASRRNQGDVR